MSDHGTLRDHLVDVITLRNQLLRQVELLKQRIDELTDQYGALWKVYDPE